MLNQSFSPPRGEQNAISEKNIEVKVERLPPVDINLSILLGNYSKSSLGRGFAISWASLLFRWVSGILCPSDTLILFFILLPIFSMHSSRLGPPSNSLSSSLESSASFQRVSNSSLHPRASAGFRDPVVAGPKNTHVLVAVAHVPSSFHVDQPSRNALFYQAR